MVLCEFSRAPIDSWWMIRRREQLFNLKQITYLFHNSGDELCPPICGDFSRNAKFQYKVVDNRLNNTYRVFRLERVRFDKLGHLRLWVKDGQYLDIFFRTHNSIYLHWLFCFNTIFLLLALRAFRDEFFSIFFHARPKTNFYMLFNILRVPSWPLVGRRWKSFNITLLSSKLLILWTLLLSIPTYFWARPIFILIYFLYCSSYKFPIYFISFSIISLLYYIYSYYIISL